MDGDNDMLQAQVRTMEQEGKGTSKYLISLDDKRSQISLTDIVASLDKMNTSLSKRFLNEKYPSPLPTSLQVESFSNKDSKTASDALSKKSFENNIDENPSVDVQEKE